MLNIGATIMQLVVAFGISFLLTPFIVGALGVEANGFVGLMGNIVTSLSVLVLVLNSVTSRFVTLHWRAGRKAEAEGYYSTAYANGLAGVAILVPLMVVIVFGLGTWIDVPEHLVVDVRLLAAVMQLSLLFNIMFPPWKVATFVSNRLYLDSFRTLQAAIVRALVIVLMFVLLVPRVAYVGIGSLASAVVVAAYSFRYKRLLLDDLRVRVRSISWAKAKELLSAGGWYAVNFVGGLLFTVLDLLFAGIFLGARAMGILALAKTIPGMLNQFGLSLGVLQMPQFTFAFAAGDMTALRRHVKVGVRLLFWLASVVIGCVVAYGQTFFHLWVPDAASEEMYWLSVISTVGVAAVVVAAPLTNVFVVTNQQRRHSLLVVAAGIASLLTVVVALGVLGGDEFTLVLVGSTFLVLKTVVITAPLSCRLMGARFLGALRESVFLSLILASSLVCAHLVSRLIEAEGWGMLFLGCTVSVLLAGVANLWVVPRGLRERLWRGIAKRELQP